MIVHFRNLARRVGIGKVLRLVYHRPVGLARQCILEGGPFEQGRIVAGRRAMMKAAESLPSLVEPPGGPPAQVAFLTGPDYWYQTAFCFVSLQLLVPFKITPIIFDDGGLTDVVRDCLRRVIPWVHFVDRDAIEARLDQVLPFKTFPSLRARRASYPHLRKLIDMQIGSTSQMLVLDSDMLFFAEPRELIEWFAEPRAIYMQDVKTAYGYPPEFLSQLVGAPLPERVNVGLYALDGDGVDWDQLEYWCGAQLKDYGPNYLQEQALTAMLFAKMQATPLPRSEYVVLPDLAEGRAPKAVMHHYVAQSKRSYFQYGWQRVLERANICSNASGLSVAVSMSLAAASSTN